MPAVTVVPLYSLRADDRRGNAFFLHKIVASGVTEDTFAVPGGLATAWCFDAGRARGDRNQTEPVSCNSNAPSENTVSVNLIYGDLQKGTEIFVVTRHKDKLK